MAYLLFPGRHHLLTNFQLQELNFITQGDISTFKDVHGKNIKIKEPIDTIIWVITSANHSNTRRNPIPGYRREAMIEDFGRDIDAKSFVYHIDDIGVSPRFAHYVISKIEVDSNGKHILTPENTILGCSTPEVIDMYEKLGFQTLPFELENIEKRTFKAELPWDMVENIIDCNKKGTNRQKDTKYLQKVSRASRKMYEKYDFGDLIINLHNDPLLGNDGDITETRDYNTYVRAFDNGAKRKYEIIKNTVKPGRIVDIGCCTGSLIRELTLDERFRESDFYGIEVARKLYNECLHRKAQGHFANENVFFYQRNVATSNIFPSNNIDTFTTFSLTHEIMSYQKEKTLTNFISLIYDQLKFGGRWINVDVVGPENKDEIVYMKLNTSDGINENYDRIFDKNEQDKFREYLDSLSTYSRFLRFAQDFRFEENELIKYKIEDIEGSKYIKLKMQDACEFLSKKDYTDNWYSEMHETFCFWSFSDWQKTLKKHNFKILKESHDFTNPWIVENRFEGKVEFFKKNGNKLESLDYPVTNMVIVVEK
ncbi:transferase [Candidatus Gracilibacteria bacterium]|nr:transferase [Candidatus Gracilibacteria bacterium]